MTGDGAQGGGAGVWEGGVEDRATRQWALGPSDIWAESFALTWALGIFFAFVFRLLDDYSMMIIGSLLVASI